MNAIEKSFVIDSAANTRFRCCLNDFGRGVSAEIAFTLCTEVCHA